MTRMIRSVVRRWLPAAALCIAAAVSGGGASAQETAQQHIDAAIAAVSRLQNALVEASSLSTVTARFEALHTTSTAASSWR